MVKNKYCWLLGLSQSILLSWNGKFPTAKQSEQCQCQDSWLNHRLLINISGHLDWTQTVVTHSSCFTALMHCHIKATRCHPALYLNSRPYIKTYQPYTVNTNVNVFEPTGFWNATPMIGTESCIMYLGPVGKELLQLQGGCQLKEWAEIKVEVTHVLRERLKWTKCKIFVSMQHMPKRVFSANFPEACLKTNMFKLLPNTVSG